MLCSREDYRCVLEKRAADYVMIDPTWAGGISETRRLAEFAQTHTLPATMHDCTGPLTLFAGLHVATAVPNVVFQESVRAHIRTFYSRLIETNVTLESGFALPPTAPGLGTRLLPALFTPAASGYRRTDSNS
jgi:L-alanine-DL-glutamate epimerase-like enolase superfamily enzyme